MTDLVVSSDLGKVKLVLTLPEPSGQQAMMFLQTGPDSVSLVEAVVC